MLNAVRTPERAAYRHEGRHGRLEERCGEEGEAVRSQGLRGRLGRVLSGDAERLEHVGRTGARGDRAIAVLGDVRAGRGCDERGCGGDVEGAGRVAACAAGVDEQVAFGRGEGDGGGPGAQRVDEAGELELGLAADAEAAEQGGQAQRELGGGRRVEERLEQRAGVGAGKWQARFEDLPECIEDWVGHTSNRLHRLQERRNEVDPLGVQ